MLVSKLLNYRLSTSVKALETMEEFESLNPIAVGAKETFPCELTVFTPRSAKARTGTAQGVPQLTKKTYALPSIKGAQDRRQGAISCDFAAMADG